MALLPGSRRWGGLEGRRRWAPLHTQGHSPRRAPAALRPNPHHPGPSSGLLRRRGSWAQASALWGRRCRLPRGGDPGYVPSISGATSSSALHDVFQDRCAGRGHCTWARSPGCTGPWGVGSGWLGFRPSGPPLARPLAEREEAGSHSTASGFPGKLSQPLGQLRGPSLPAAQSWGRFPAICTLTGRLPNELQAPVGPPGA